MSRTLRSVLFFLFILLVLMAGGVMTLFLMQNGQWVVVRIPTVVWNWSSPLAVTEFETPLSVAVMLSFALGAFLVGLMTIPVAIQRAVQRNRDRRFIDGLEGELVELRNLPVTNPAPFEDIAEDDDPVSPEDDEAALLDALQEVGGSAR